MMILRTTYFQHKGIHTRFVCLAAGVGVIVVVGAMGVSEAIGTATS
jgi:acid phosphatase family membrane protein YuiD